MLTFWADSLIDHDEKPRELNVLSHGQRDLWDNHQACLEQKVICAHTHSQSHRASVFCTQKMSFHFLSRNEAVVGVWWWVGPDHCSWRWKHNLRAQKSFT